MMSLRGVVAALVLGLTAILPAQAAQFSADQTDEIKTIRLGCNSVHRFG